LKNNRPTAAQCAPFYLAIGLSTLGHPEIAADSRLPKRAILSQMMQGEFAGIDHENHVRARSEERLRPDD
jgi:hypothetical protein